MGFPETPKPATFGGFPASNFLLQSQNGQAKIQAVTEKLKADGFTSVDGEMWMKEIRDAAPTHMTPVDPWPVVTSGFPTTPPTEKPKVHNPFEFPSARGQTRANDFDATNPAFAPIPPHDKPTYVVHDPAPPVGSELTFIGYQSAQSYILLSGPYSPEELTPEQFDKVYALFERDNTLRIPFPADKINRANMTTFMVDAHWKRKGAYGRV